ncbi:HNH endonuclease [Pseudooceanicola nitratireducens]|uniref:HNH endonuclease n=1 Tax=Pseudooceanicola nitratireducens TaxID=517719 RepID=UPI003C7D6178
MKRQLRQEAYFGCAQCGSPILEFHHIFPWSEKQHNDVDHMIALCPTHHASLGKMHPSKCYALKENPYNRRKGYLKGMLGTSQNFSAFHIGSNTFINTPTILEYCRKPIIQYKVYRKQILLSTYIPDEKFWPSLEIIDNEITANRHQVWDIVFRTNYLKPVRPDKSFLKLTFARMWHKSPA